MKDRITSAGILNYSAFGADKLLWTLVTCSASLLSRSLSARSSKRKIKSNLERRAAGRLMFSCGCKFLLYLPYTGFAAASIEVLAFKEVVMPALAIEIVYCSITS